MKESNTNSKTKAINGKKHCLIKRVQSTEIIDQTMHFK